METNQKQTSTVGHSTQNCVQFNQSIKKTIETNQPAQNSVGQSTSAEISVNVSQPVVKSADQNVLAQNGKNRFPQSGGKPAGQSKTAKISGLTARYSKGGILHFPPAPVKRDKERFSFKDCKAWNTYRAECTDAYVLGNIDPGYTGCAILNIPDDPHPWNALRSVIDQFYQRERDIARERYNARIAIKETTKQKEYISQLEKVLSYSYDIIEELKKKLAQAQNKFVKLDDNQPANNPAYLSPLKELLALCDAGEWVDSIDSIIDCLISLMCNDKDMIDGSDLYYARRLREFFVKLSKAEQIKDIDPTSKYI